MRTYRTVIGEMSQRVNVVKNRCLFAAWSTLIVCCLASCADRGTNKSDETISGKEISWQHLSSENGDIPAPGPSTQQTASMVVDVDKDGINDFIIGARKQAPALSLFRRMDDRWEKYIIEPELLAIEAGGAFHDIDGDGDLDILFGGDASTNEVWWWENPFPQFNPEQPWKRRIVKNTGGNKHHDQTFGDFDGDKKVELAFWNQRDHALCFAEIPEDPALTSHGLIKRSSLGIKARVSMKVLVKAILTAMALSILLAEEGGLSIRMMVHLNRSSSTRCNNSRDLLSGN